MTQLQHTINAIDTFTDADLCVKFLNEIKDEKVFLVVSSTFARQIVPLIHHLPQLDCIYVLGCDPTCAEDWTKNWSKIKGIFSEIVSICTALQEAARRCDQYSTPISFISDSQFSSVSRNLEELDSLFMYTQILKEIVLELDYDYELSIQKLVTYCRDQNVDTREILKFELEYRSHTPIWWYTSPYFLFSMLNRALRTLEVDIIMKMAFFIHDLHHHIEQLHREQSHNQEHERLLKAYRGQGLSKNDFEQLMQKRGGLMSFNNFLSTSEDRAVSLLYADSNRYNPDLVGILFEITIDQSMPSSPYGFLNNISFFSTEHEILFSMHTVFRIGNMEQIDGSDRLWVVHLTLTSDTDPQLNALTARLREETKQYTRRNQLGILLIDLGKLTEAQEVYELLLHQEFKDSARISYYHQLGTIKCSQGYYREAISFFQDALELSLKSLPSGHTDFLAAIYSNLGRVHCEISEYSKALSFFEKALDIDEKTVPQNYSALAMSYNNISVAYEGMNEFAKALTLCEKALEMKQKSLPSNHPSLANSYLNIGSLYDNMDDYAQALSVYKKALEIQKKSLPSDHPSTASCYICIGNLHYKMSNYSEALSYHEKGLEIQQKILPSSHPYLANTYTNIGSVYSDIGDYSKAVSYYTMAINIEENCPLVNHRSLAASYHNIAGVFFKAEEYSKALAFYEKALEIHQKTLPSNHTDVAATYSDIGVVYGQMGEYLKAIASFEKELEVKQKLIPANHSDLTTIYDKIARLYTHMGDHFKALEIKEQSVPPNHLDLANYYNNVGVIFYETGEYSKALTFYEKKLEVEQKSLPSSHPALAITYSDIGVVCGRAGEYSKAILSYEKLLEIKGKALPPNHSDFATIYGNIGDVYENMSKYSDALSYYERAVQIAQCSLSSDHPDLEIYKKRLQFIREKL
jgi:tetratricopeptide (TPR) repeat protein